MMKTKLTALALAAVASTAGAQSIPYHYAYEATLEALGGGNNVLAHEFGNCSQHGSSQQMFAVINSSGQQREDALNAMFKDNPAAVRCFVEVLVRYDIIDPSDLRG